MKGVITMGCCGQKRANLKSTAPPPTASPTTMPANAQFVQSAQLHNQPRSPSSQPAPGGAQPMHEAVTLRYLESSPIRVRGLVTGQQYEFSGARPIQVVDARDAQAFLRTRFFAESRIRN